METQLRRGPGQPELGLPPSVSLRLPGAGGSSGNGLGLGEQRLRRQHGTLSGRGRVFVPLGCFPGATRMEGDAQVCGEGRRLAPRPGAGTPGRAVFTTLVLGNFWPIGPAPLGPSGRLSPRPKGLSRCLARRGAIGRGSGGAAAATTLRRAQVVLARRARRPVVPPAARPGPLRAGRERDERRRWGNPTAIPAKRPGGKGRAGGGKPAPHVAQGLHPQPDNCGPVSRSGRKKEEVGPRGGPRPGLGVAIHSHCPHPLYRREGVQVVIKKARPNRGIPPYPLKKH